MDNAMEFCGIGYFGGGLPCFPTEIVLYGSRANSNYSLHLLQVNCIAIGRQWTLLLCGKRSYKIWRQTVDITSKMKLPSQRGF